MTATGSAAVPATDRLFAYGTLMTGFSRRHLLGPAILEGEARVRGSLYDFGEYPGLVLDAADGDDRRAGRSAGEEHDAPGWPMWPMGPMWPMWVVGELYRVPDLLARLSTLDAEERYDPADPAGSLYVRRPVLVTTHGGTRDAWVYVYNPAVGGPPERGPRIESGDWRAHLAARRAVPR